MAFNNPAMEQMIEQRRIQIEALRQERDEIQTKVLDVILGKGRYAVNDDGDVHHELGELELDESANEALIGAQIRLREIARDLKAFEK